MMAALLLTSCNDFFDPNTDDELNGEDYISSQTEMYTGFIGIMTKLQAIGDKEILLTDTRGELLEPTDNSNNELISLYNYDDTLQSNSYANPAGYYEVIIACNDYLTKMAEYESNPNVDKDIYDNLVASTMRVKIWTYKTLAEIYGKAVWFDDPITKVTSIKDSTRFEVMDIDQIVDRCLSLMQTGYKGIDLSHNINWVAWLDPDKVTDVANSQYRKWNYMVPPFAGLYAELCLWKGAALDAQQGVGNETAKTYYKLAADSLLSALNVQISANDGSNGYYLPCAYNPARYPRFWDNNIPYPTETVAALIYDYTKNQTNTLLKHFSTEYPNKYWLRPSEQGMAKFYDNEFNPGGKDGSARSNCLFKQDGGRYYIAKFRPMGSSYRARAYQDDVHIFIYRATMYHMLLSEALNHLGRFNAMDAVFNSGVTSAKYVATNPEWEGFTQDWTQTASWGTRRYPSMGIRGCYNLNARKVMTEATDVPVANVIKYNDLAILDEYLLEFACEGKNYPAMIRMARRYKDNDIIASRVCRKYTSESIKNKVNNKIMQGGYWVPFDLKI